jgi:hypothetical protein
LPYFLKYKFGYILAGLGMETVVIFLAIGNIPFDIFYCPFGIFPHFFVCYIYHEKSGNPDLKFLIPDSMSSF